jgi:hypothetical protein
VFSRVHLVGVLAAIALFAACTDNDTTLERKGGTIPDPQGSAGADSSAGASGVSGDAVPFCAALQVIRDKCQRCHGNPLQNGAPTPFLTYEDTQAQYYMTKSKWWEIMKDAVTKDFMPATFLNSPPQSVMPPVEPLTMDEKTTLLTWLAQGAKPAGGTNCP